MPAPRFIRIGAPSGDGPPAAEAVPAPERAATAAPAPGSILPPEVFGVWSEDVPPVPPPARADGSPNGRGAASGGHRPAASVQVPAAMTSASPTVVRRGPAPAPPPLRGGRVSHEDERLNAMRKSGRPIEAVCFENVRVAGRLVAFDQYALILEVGGQETVLFKHGVIMVRYAE